MQNLSTETVEALKNNRLALFVHFDFLFFPMRVHSGESSVDWEGNNWEGIGDILRQGASSSSMLISSHDKNRGKISASLPMSKEMLEILSNGYFRDRKMQWMVCSLNADGEVIDRVYGNEGGIVEYSRKDDTITFTANIDLLNSNQEHDARHKRKVVAIRQQFRWDLVDTAISNGLGWIVNMFGVFVGQIGLVIDVVSMVVPGRRRRIVQQRWQARERTYWFRTEPIIPNMKMHRNRYKVRADTLDEAKAKLYGSVVDKIWYFPRGFLMMVVYVNDRPLEYLDLEQIRKNVDPKRCEETNPVRAWGLPESSGKK